MKNLLLKLSGAVLMSVLVSSSAVAATFDFSFSGATDQGSGVLTANPTGVLGRYLLTGMTGTMNGLAISQLLPVGSYPVVLAASDNVFFFPGTGGVLLDVSGMSFALADGTDVNIYFGQFGTGDPISYNLISGKGETNDVLTSFSATQVTDATTPEPGSLVLLGTGALGIAGMRRRSGRDSRPVGGE